MNVSSGPGHTDKTTDTAAAAAAATTNDITLQGDKPYHSKKPHKKSRSGCKNCKTRKVKCDEARPSCRNCVLRKTDCVYPKLVQHSHGACDLPSPPSSSASPRSHATNRTSDDNVSGLVLKEPLFLPSCDRDATDMKLLWFYTTNTFSSFATQAGSVKKIDDILKIKIPSHAFKTPFLMDCLLGTAALELQHLNQDISPSRALRYRARAFEGYRKAIEEGNPETFPALVAGSLLLTALSSQMFREEGTKDLYIIDWMVVWRGIGLIIDLATPQTVWESGMAELFYRPHIDFCEAALHIPSNLLAMIDSIPPDDPEYHHRFAYYNTLQYLGSLYAELVNGFGPIMTLRVVTWLTFIPRDFVELGRQKRPRALIILAYYLMFVKACNSPWWISGIGDREIGGIVRYLDDHADEWKEMLAAPRLALLLRGNVDMARLLLNDQHWTPPPVDLCHAPTRDPRTQSLTWVDDDGQTYKGTPSRVGDFLPDAPAAWEASAGYQQVLLMPERAYASSVLEAIDLGVQDPDSS